MYGHPVTLTFKKDSHYKSVLGGIVSIISFTGVLIYFLILLQALITRQNFQVSSAVTMRDEMDYSFTLKLNPSNFDFAYKLLCAVEDCNGITEQYFSVSM